MPRFLLKNVEVYRNLNRGLWSVRKDGLVVRRPASLTLANARFKVSQAGRQRALREGVRNVHAFACGDYLGPAEPDLVSRLRMVQVSYNPFRRPELPASFYLKPDGDAVSASLMLMFLEDATVWACHPVAIAA